MRRAPSWEMASNEMCPHMGVEPPYRRGGGGGDSHAAAFFILDVSPLGKCPLIEGVSLLADVPLLEVSLCSTCPFMGGVPLWEVSLHAAL